jgi:hypothetical protein
MSRPLQVEGVNTQLPVVTSSLYIKNTLKISPIRVFVALSFSENRCQNTEMTDK